MNVHIRHATPADYESVSRIFCGPKAIWGTFQVPFPSPELWRKRLAEPESGLTALVAGHESDLIGMLGLHTHPQVPRRRHAGYIGMAVRDDCQGQGVGTALMRAALELADQWLNLTRLELNVFTDNAPAVHLYQKFGFAIEGTLRQFAFRDGEFVDAYAMGRLRADAVRSHSK
jgi:L-phenylalanine/L-methionine N-acetyltransferase